MMNMPMTTIVDYVDQEAVPKSRPFAKIMRASELPELKLCDEPWISIPSQGQKVHLWQVYVDGYWQNTPSYFHSSIAIVLKKRAHALNLWVIPSTLTCS
eukprot:12431262-Karenia_brevis.AAC.1